MVEWLTRTQDAGMSKTLKSHIGSKLRLARQKDGLTQEQLGAKVHKSTEAISNIERGNSFTSIKTLDKFAQALNVPLIYFFEDYDRKSRRGRQKSEARLALVSAISDLADRDVPIVSNLVDSLLENRKR